MRACSTSSHPASTGWKERPPTPADADLPGDLFSQPLPASPVPFDDLIGRLERDVLPGGAYNGHPRWLAYIMGAPAPVSVLGSFVSAALNQNTGLWRVAPSATAIEVQTLAWIAEMLGLPKTSEGLFVSGGQMANIVAHAVARDVKTPWDTRRYGMRGPEGHAPRVRIYASKELHYCHEQAAELLGMGRDAIRAVPVDERLPHARRRARADDRRRSRPRRPPDRRRRHRRHRRHRRRRPDPAARSSSPAARISGSTSMARTAHSPTLASDVPAPNSARSPTRTPSPATRTSGCTPPSMPASSSSASPAVLERSFGFHASYLETVPSDGHVDFLERSPENSRPNRALKVWLAIQSFGRDGYAAMIDYNMRLAAYMEELVRTTPALELAAPRALSIVCWRVRPDRRRRRCARQPSRHASSKSSTAAASP